MLAGLAAVVGAGLLVVAAVVLLGGGGDADGTVEAVAPGGRTSTSPADPVGSPATATSAAERVVLRPDGLGVVDFGASPAHTYAALTEALGVSGFNLDFLAPGPSEFDHLTSAAGFDALVDSGEMALFGATGEDPADVCTSAGGHA